ncbi:glycosyltransferase family 2 protein [Patescibacteria group bacterium]
MTNIEEIKYSLVIPTYNEQENVIQLHQEITSVMNTLNQPFEIIFIDDGSSDDTFKKLKTLRPVKIIRFRKNFGQTAAMDAGFHEAAGEIIVTMDADRQNDPKDIPRLINKINEGYDVVSGWRWQRKDSASKNFISRGANTLRSILIKDNIHDSGCTLKAYRRECFHKLTLFGEMHRFIPAMLRWQGFRIGEIKVNHRPRVAGQTKYSWRRIVKGFVDMLSVWFWRKYASRPLHLFGGVGLLLILSGSVLGIILFVLRYFYSFSLANRIWPLVAFFLVLAGIQLFVSGLLADIAVKTYFNGNRKAYAIKDIFENKKDND